MAPTTRSKKTAAAKDADEKKTTKQQKREGKGKGKAASAAATEEEEEDAPLPFGSRMVIIILTSYVAEKIWRYRTVVSAGWYSEKQSAIEQAMITAFEYTILMGLLFFLGILISVLTVSIQKKITG